MRNAIMTFDSGVHSGANPPLNPAKTSYFTVLPKLFGFRPLDLAKNISIRPCFICKENLEANKDFESTIMAVRPCGHYFHVVCVFEYWDEPGMNCHRCPECRRVAELNIETVDFSAYEYGCEPFAHNVFGYRDSASGHNPSLYGAYDSYTTLRLLPHANRTIEKYDVPPEPVNYVNQENPDQNDYWTRENELLISISEAELHWGARWYEAGITATDPNYNNDADPLPRLLQKDWIRMREHLPMYDQRDLLDKSSFRSFPPAKFMPAAEAAFMRRRRRQRDKQRRRKAECRGIPGLAPGMTSRRGIRALYVEP